MVFLGADADFGAEAELGAVGEAGAGVVIDCRRIYFVQKALGRRRILGDDGFGVAGAVGFNVRQGVVQAVHHPDGGDEREEFASPVVGVGRFGAGAVAVVEGVGRAEDA